MPTLPVLPPRPSTEIGVRLGEASSPRPPTLPLLLDENPDSAGLENEAVEVLRGQKEGSVMEERRVEVSGIGPQEDSNLVEKGLLPWQRRRMIGGRTGLPERLLLPLGRISHLRLR